jgi:CO dehydrogenase maturation factor
MPKIAITGKGGVGKTTLAALLARAAKSRGYSVLAVDADPDPNLAMALGIAGSARDAIVPLSEMNDLIEERTGAKKGSMGAYFKMNPRVDDIPDRFAVDSDGVRLVVMGSVDTGGSGCVCPESVLLKAFVTHLLLRSDEFVVLDMEAGVEHLGRGTAQSVDALIIVIEPGQRSIQTARTIKRLADDLGIQRMLIVANKLHEPAEEAVLKEALPDFEFLGSLPYSEAVQRAELAGERIEEGDPAYTAAAGAVFESLEGIWS